MSERYDASVNPSDRTEAELMLLDRIARIISGAPFPSARSQIKAQQVLDMALDGFVVVRDRSGQLAHGDEIDQCAWWRADYIFAAERRDDRYAPVWRRVDDRAHGILPEPGDH